MPSVEIIVPHRSRWDLLSRLIESLDAQTVPAALCVFDNASEDDTLFQLMARPDIRVIGSPENVGFGRAVNAGVRSSEAEYVITLNNDMVAAPDFVERMLAELTSAPDLAVAALQLGTDGRVDTIGVAVDQSLCAYDVGFGADPDRIEDEVLHPIGPSGGAAGYRRETFLRYGGYDEHIFAYLEDVDLAIRMQSGGIRYRLAREARVVHRHSSTLGSGSRGKNELMGFSRGHLLWKYGRQLSRSARLRGYVIDGVVYGGQLVVDRNMSALAGRHRAHRHRPATGRSPITPPVQTLDTTAALKRRLSRR